VNRLVLPVCVHSRDDWL